MSDPALWSDEMNVEPDRPETDAAEEENGGAEEEAVTESPAEEAAADDPLAELRVTADENWDKYLRAAAELENVRKRAARDVENAHKFALERFASDLLTVCDSFEMALAADEASVESLQEGNEATMKQLIGILQRFGVEEVDPEGEPFDPELHEAMTMQPTDDVEPGSVITVFQKGYALNGRLLRPARVVVASESAEKG
ncbi:MAG: nucleotide exchange factor GrpE [Woeseiaceae bacterium]|nr:nucleotide exchange factor GrpE [Woeseiaceae bacterium]